MAILALSAIANAQSEPPAPAARWTFNTDARDVVGAIPSALRGSAAIEAGSLRLNGADAYLEAGPLPFEVREKTLTAWVRLAGLEQRGGGVISIEQEGGSVFDSIVLGEREPGKWMAGSELWNRSADLEAPVESSPVTEWIHVAAVYGSGGSIELYRNGIRYGMAWTPSSEPKTYPAGTSRVLVGLRHSAPAAGRLISGWVEDAALYTQALTAEQIAGLASNGPGVRVTGHSVEPVGGLSEGGGFSLRGSSPTVGEASAGATFSLQAGSLSVLGVVQVSGLPSLAIEWVEGEAILVWDGAPELGLEQTSDPVAGPWANADLVVETASGRSTARILNVGSRKFYRLAKTNP